MRSTVKTREVAQKVVDYIAEHPQEHSQSLFWAPATDADTALIDINNICDTTMCVAGTAVYITDGIEGMIASLYNGRHPTLSFAGRGASLLGLNKVEADALFYCMDDAAAVDAVRALAQGDQEKFWEAIESAVEDE
jgi:hypothetical protein